MPHFLVNLGGDDSCSLASSQTISVMSENAPYQTRVSIVNQGHRMSSTCGRATTDARMSGRTFSKTSQGSSKSHGQVSASKPRSSRMALGVSKEPSALSIGFAAAHLNPRNVRHWFKSDLRERTWMRITLSRTVRLYCSRGHQDKVTGKRVRHTA